MEELLGVPKDTSSEAEEFLFARLREMSPGEKIQRMAKLCVLARRFVIAGIHASYPECNDDELRKRLAARLYGREISMKYFSFDPEQEGY